MSYTASHWHNSDQCNMPEEQLAVLREPTEASSFPVGLHNAFLFSLFNAPLFAVFVLGMFTTWATPAAGFCGLLFGVGVAACHNMAVRYGAIPYGSQMLANFYGAIYGWVSCVLVVTVVSSFTKRTSLADLDGITYFTQDRTNRLPRASVVLAMAVLATCAALNILFR